MTFGASSVGRFNHGDHEHWIKDNKPLLPVITTALLPGATLIEAQPSVSIRDVSLFRLNRSSSFFSKIYTKYYMLQYACMYGYVISCKPLYQNCRGSLH